MVWYSLYSYRFDKIITTYANRFGKYNALIEAHIKDKLIFSVAYLSARHEQSIIFLLLADCTLV